MNGKVNRRQFLSINLGATVGFLGNFIGTQIEQERDFFRPPGARNELEFLTSCSRCGKCKDICPEKVISLFTITDGAKLINTPFLNPNENPCTFCRKCVDVCPTDALSITCFLEDPSIGKAAILDKSCISFKEVMCDYCFRSCPVNGAIELIEGKPMISDDHCTGCGICVTNCISEHKGIHILTI
ncbi:4Fe-4S dicluster domain-containing protein [Cytobacillus dafuensis]|uniref:4Fe-4S dicluster domain-containing protein n=1 Tax=Cytobacillus dafuensis TaxID=1742359 RepID=A0A5B8Z420_CYTDA|nr:4Fe-4S dicluster domain-containing protein [Cytobacillus dafuensis]QED47850.1 4Fe-4S dicluster domain-containing protein [Cytobacillus dafuensis]